MALHVNKWDFLNKLFLVVITKKTCIYHISTKLKASGGVKTKSAKPPFNFHTILRISFIVTELFIKHTHALSILVDRTGPIVNIRARISASE